MFRNFLKITLRNFSKNKTPINSYMTFSVLTHYDNYLKFTGLKNNDWTYFNAATFVMTDGQSIRKTFLTMSTTTQ